MAAPMTTIEGAMLEPRIMEREVLVPQLQTQEVVREVPRLMTQEVVRNVPVPQMINILLRLKLWDQHLPLHGPWFQHCPFDGCHRCRHRHGHGHGCSHGCNWCRHRHGHWCRHGGHWCRHGGRANERG